MRPSSVSGSAGKYHAPQQQRGRAGTYIKGYKKVPTYEDILGQELRNSKVDLYLPERYVFQALQVGEAEDEATEDLKEQKEAVRGAARRDDEDRDGDEPMPVARGRRGASGPAGQDGPPGPPGASSSAGPRCVRASARERERLLCRANATSGQVIKVQNTAEAS